MAVSRNQGPLVGSPYDKDHRILGSILDPAIYWFVVVKELNLSYHIPNTLLFPVNPYYGSFKLHSLTATQIWAPDLWKPSFGYPQWLPGSGLCNDVHEAPLRDPAEALL